MLDPAVEQGDSSREALGDAVIVRDHRDRGSFIVELLQEAHDVLPGALSRLPVGSSASTIAGSPDDRPGDRYSLALAAGELGGQMVLAVAEPDSGEGSRGPVPPLGQRHAGVEQAIRDVVESRFPGEEEELLEHEADVRERRAESWRSDSSSMS